MLKKIFVICALFLVSAVSVFAQDKTGEIYKKFSPSVVLIKTDKAAGSGFIVSANGIIVTALHVIDGASKVAVKTPSGDIFDTVSLLAKDERRDIAILKIAGFDLPFVNLTNSVEIKPGEKVIVIGNPLGSEQLQASISDGIMSGLRDLGDGYKVIQFTAPISTGNSGGPAFSDSGAVIGVVVFKLRNGESLNFAVPINYIRGMMETVDIAKPVSQWSSLVADSVFAKKNAAKSTRWKSLATGTIKIVRFDDDYIHIETELSKDLTSLGAYVLAELKKDGGKYIGTSRERAVWWKTKSSGEKYVVNSCVWESPIEISSITQNRMEGRVFTAPYDAKLDRKKCTRAEKPQWQNFVWVLE